MFPSQPAYASELLGEIKTHEISIEMKKNAKNHP